MELIGSRSLGSVLPKECADRPVIQSLIRPWEKSVAVRELQLAYSRHLTRKTLGELPKEVDHIFCASDMVFSTPWYYRRRTADHRRTGNDRAGWIKDWKPIPVAEAVAASSCFPPVFAPLHLNRSPDEFVKPAKRPANWETLVAGLALTDGGVYDNLGLEPVWNSYKFLVCSDGGSPLAARASKGMGQLVRYVDLIQSQVSSLRRRWLIDRSESAAYDFQSCYLGLHLCPDGHAYPKDFVDRFITPMRTDLDGFSETEAGLLENHSYLLADHYLRKYLCPVEKCCLPFDEKALESPQMPHPHLRYDAALCQSLSHSHKPTFLYFTRPGWF